MNGVICVNKPQGFTSFDVVAKLRGILKIKKIGHAGTLDPMATGVLPVFIGSAAKACDMLENNSKSYSAGFSLGMSTDTQDITGNVIERKSCLAKRQDVEKLLAQFCGEISQIPPMFSAVSIGGKRLYELARKGVEVERPPRLINVSRFELTQFDEQTHSGTLLIECSKGTYVRTLIHDLGQALACGAVMTSLVRLSSNGFTLDDCLTLPQIEQLSADNNLASRIIPVDTLFSHLPKLFLGDAQTSMYKNGIRLDLNRLDGITESPRYAVYGCDKHFIGTARKDNNTGVLVIEKNFFV